MAFLSRILLLETQDLHMVSLCFLSVLFIWLIPTHPFRLASDSLHLTSKEGSSDYAGLFHTSPHTGQYLFSSTSSHLPVSSRRANALSSLFPRCLAHIIKSLSCLFQMFSRCSGVFLKFQNHGFRRNLKRPQVNSSNSFTMPHSSK